MIDRLQPHGLLRVRDGTDRDHRVPVVRLHINLAQILRTGARLIVGFNDDLVLIIRLFDEIDIVLRIGGAQQALELRGGDTVGAGAVAFDLDVRDWACCGKGRSAADWQSP